MKFLLKFSLFFLISLNAFAAPALDYESVSGGRDSGFPGWSGLLPGASLISDSYLRVNDNIYQISFKIYGFFNYDKGHTPGIAYLEGNYKYEPKWIFVYESSNTVYTAYCLYFPENKNLSVCKPEYENYKDFRSYGVPIKTTYYASYEVVKKVATCQPGENFNTSTGKCVAPCPVGQKWDQAGNKCFVDCTDVNKNKWGFTDGSCIDCSSKTTSNDVRKCYCEGIGSAPDWGVTTSKDNVIYTALCKNGLAFNFKDPKTPDIKDNNKTDPSNPGGGDPSKPGGDKPGGGSGGGNQGGKDNNGTKPGNGGGSGKDNNGTKPGNGGGNGGNNGKGNGDEPTFNADDFNFDGLKAGENSFVKEFSNAVEKSVSQVDKFTSGVDQFIDNVKGKGMSSLSKKSIPTTCSHKYYINFFGKKLVEMDFDFCKVVAPASGAFYYLFYVFFFAAFLILIVKLLIFSF
ncbi:hypothetical protein [Campylobacter curvus]|uniref:hypothetical protein n=1 Tax=Campylobacter curvus TaxID=200 RepID=UPI0019CFB2A7|nr:hypothetical protein [Campylobacter curvus]MBN7289029.1 hypothetical protein [Campylobacter curvus]